jgi:hypothetical protein
MSHAHMYITKEVDYGNSRVTRSLRNRYAVCFHRPAPLDVSTVQQTETSHEVHRRFLRRRCHRRCCRPVVSTRSEPRGERPATACSAVQHMRVCVCVCVCVCLRALLEQTPPDGVDDGLMKR